MWSRYVGRCSQVLELDILGIWLKHLVKRETRHVINTMLGDKQSDIACVLQVGDFTLQVQFT